jgi:fructose PTS system EIIA component
MDFGDIIGPENHISELKAADRWQAIDELLDNLVMAGKIKTENLPAIVQAVKQRETAMSTAVLPGVLLPHASTNLVSDVVAAVGRSKFGISFAAPGERPVHLMVLFLVPVGQNDKHVHVLANIAKALAKEPLKFR